jgi:hypothetical protein
LFCFFVIFNKTDLRCPEFEVHLHAHKSGDWYKTLYFTAGVNFLD